MVNSSSSVPTSKTSLSTSTTPVHAPATIASYQQANLTHPANLSPLRSANKPIPYVEPLSIKVASSSSRPATSNANTVPAFLHLSPVHSSTRPPSTAAILISGAGGGVTGPSGIYLSIADKLASLSAAIPVLRLDYRYPSNTRPCCEDVVAGMDYMESAFGIRRFVLVGWSFGGAPVFTVAAMEKERVVGCATVASQTSDTEGIKRLAPRPLLLLHGSGDQTLDPWCSEWLYDTYGDARGGKRELKIFDGDDHSLRRNSVEAERMLCEFIVGCAGAQMEDVEKEMVGKALIEEGKKVEVMKKGGALRGEENVE